MTGNAGGPAGPPASGDSAAPPTCYRHPDRETYIRCSRCNKPICPDCMIAAPVGYQCPQCVAEGRKGVRQARTALGGQRREGNANLVTLTIIGINVVIWVMGLVIGTRGDTILAEYARASGTNELAARLGLVLGDPTDAFSFGIVDGEWYRVITATFMHVSVLHIALNMLALYMLGSQLEPLLGRSRFITLYLLSALGGSAASLLMVSAPYNISIGASGAVYGLFGALFVVARKLGGDTRSILVVLALNLAFSFTISGIDWRAHLGGLAIGTALAAVFAYAPREQRSLWGLIGSLGAALLITTVIMIAVI
ncbi:rhomboid family intramembrane serine protease [Jiangella alkaliphila]|uniref:Membrane associated serine protease, rhomboid family n=1 Tax=Jiangella alkaliphila TaxID=419479 RepID=A0A1H2HGW4_9ACTN|nr:rhomboid family intramembrane serine protease [Jiangella alkaliphila]SDU31127.1 Membrane associated serine protease, rhomboid family [Jiangella alkaliphila]